MFPDTPRWNKSQDDDGGDYGIDPTSVSQDLFDWLTRPCFNSFWKLSQNDNHVVLIKKKVSF